MVIGGMMSASSAGQEPEQHLIHVEDAEVEIEHYPEDWLAFALFWALAFIVFLQFFTRYILNDSLAWTEEIARYGLMCVTFIGGAMVTRRNSHIAVVLLPNLLPAAPARLLLALVDLITLGFLGPARLLLGADRGAHAGAAHDRDRPVDELRLRRHRVRLLPDAGPPDPARVAQRCGTAGTRRRRR